MHKISAKLDWTRMLGFEQIADGRLAARDSGVNWGAKVGGKVGNKLGAKSGLKN